MRSKTNDSDSQAFLDVCADLFALVLCLRKLDDIENPSGLYQDMVSRISPLGVEERPRDPKGYAIYALVGFIDETMALKRNLRWESRLEMTFFGTNTAGNDFFTYLDKMMETQANQPTGGALEVYYLCLVLGFEGELAGGSETRRSRRQKYIDDVQRLIDPGIVEMLSPHGERPQETIERKRSHTPRWLPWAVTGGCVAIMIFLLIFLRVRIGYWAAGVINRIQSFL